MSRLWTKGFFLTTFLIQLLLLFDGVEGKGKRRKCPPSSWSEGKIVNTVLSNYTKMLPEAEDSVMVNIEIHVQDMSSLNELTSDFKIEILFTQLWHDPALAFAHLPSCKRNITMENKHLENVWTPNTCIINSKKTMIHQSPADNVMFILYENGTVWVNHRLSLKAPCLLDLRRFPFDVQNCELIFESYSHNSEEVELHWMKEPVTLMKQISLPDFDMVNFRTDKATLLYPNGYWDQLTVVFTFKRRYGFYIIQAYVPTYLTIIVSWVSFCMEPKALPARTTVGISSLLALTFQFGNILKNLPRVSYVKAMDVWMLGCISFVFGTMVELAFVCYISRCASNRDKTNRRESPRSRAAVYANGGCRTRTPHHLNGNVMTDSLMRNGVSVRESSVDPPQRDAYRLPNGPPPPLHFHMTTFDVAQPLTLEQVGGLPPPFRDPSPSPQPDCIARFHPESIDKLSIVCFPLAFTMFNLFYWWYFLSPTFDQDFLPVPHE
ncbi:unnamed protein product, partial [Mesorhabditis belari]|uniref:Uncharacterized protein n=1 Tax=Mesorhabditis belari TaxID=2138241 RepID=A0AAF3F112_9BILA